MPKLKELQIQILFNNEWHDIDIQNVKKDNIIRVKLPDGSFLKNAENGIESITISDAYVYETTKDGKDLWSVDSIPYHKLDNEPINENK